MKSSSCCQPATRTAISMPQPEPLPETGAVDTSGMCLISAGSFLMGGEDADGRGEDGEGPLRQVEMPTFLIDATCVSNLDFQRFVKATGYRTQAERSGSSCVFHLAIPRALRNTPGYLAIEDSWWLAVEGACWFAPEGPNSDLQERWDHPVVHVSWDDAQAYARWAGKRLPSEAQWEKAARGGLHGQRFAWGDDLYLDGRHHCNIWQGDFPQRNSGADGYLTTAPVNTFAANGYGLYNCSGNVWEWCEDWWSSNWHSARQPATRIDPQGPPQGEDKLMKGGSYLCHASYCNRYRLAARTRSAPHMSSAHLGFRCVL